MKIDSKKIGRLVRVIGIKDLDGDVEFPYAFPSTCLDWLDYASHNEYWHCGNLSFIPHQTVGLLVTQATVGANVTINYGKVLFPKTELEILTDPWARSQGNEAGAYWISGEFLEEVPDGEF